MSCKSNGDHVWVPAASRGFVKRERCTVCGDTFPCRHACRHEDCKEARGEPSAFDKYTQPQPAEVAEPAEINPQGVE